MSQKRAKTTKKKSRRTKASRPKVETYKDIPKPEKKASEGYIKHTWYKIAAAALIGALLGWLLRKRK